MIIFVGFNIIITKMPSILMLFIGNLLSPLTSSSSSSSTSNIIIISLFSIFFIPLSSNVFADNLPTCQPSDFQYAFTECDKYHGRYRVSVPTTPNHCVGGAPNAPVRINSCYTSCEHGTFFNSTSLDCQPCKVGYYSLGGGIKFNSFNSTNLEKSGFVISASKEPSNCTGWRVNNGVLENRPDSPYLTCSSVLSYSVNIVKRGKIRFKYQFIGPQDPSLYILFTFLHFNQKESRVNYNPWNEKNSKELSVTKDKSKWKTFTLEIFEPGYYTFVWRTFYFGNFQNQIGPNMFFQKRGIKSNHHQQTPIVSYTPVNDKYHSHSTSSSNIINGQSMLTDELGAVRVKSIEINGVSYTSECTPCEPGTYADEEKSGHCSFCPKDTYTDEYGSSLCKPCDTVTSFSFIGSSKCFPKPECTENDYFETTSQCDSRSHQRARSYHWIEPKICRESKIRLPSNREESCDPHKDYIHEAECSPGMEFFNGTCRLCPENHYNDGTLKQCTLCPPTTSPVYSLILDSWKYPLTLQDAGRPLSLTWQCIPKIGIENECDDEESPWALVPGSPSYIRSSTTASTSSLLVLSLNSPGFRSYAGGKLSFRFELRCQPGDDCVFALLNIKDITDDQLFILKEWDSNTTGIREHTVDISENLTFILKWVFSRESMTSHVRIYQITLTNAMYSGAIGCKPCPLDVESDCIPCPIGHYINTTSTTNSNNSGLNENGKSASFFASRDKRRSITSKHRPRLFQNHSSGVSSTPQSINGDTTKCVKCPANTIINRSLQFPIGQDDSCLPCGPGLVSSEDRLFCYNSCNLTLDNETFNLESISKTLTMKGATLFSGDGAAYYHLFNISLCGSQGVTCINNITDADEFDLKSVIIRSLVCRSTIVPSRSLSTQSVPLGDELLAVTHDTVYNSIFVHPEFNNTRSDIHIYMVARSTTSTCTKGRSTVITLRCEPNLDSESTILPPKSCPDGTCDGCNFHFMIKTRTSAACRVCKENDYDTVITECRAGQQEIRFINPRGCILTPAGGQMIKRRPCSTIPKELKMAVMGVTVIGIVLLALVLHFWKINRKLEYKYSKLVENKNTAECCAMDDDEDEPEVRVRSHNRKDKNNSSSDYETIQLTKHSQDDVL